MQGKCHQKEAEIYQFIRLKYLEKIEMYFPNNFRKVKFLRQNTQLKLSHKHLHFPQQLKTPVEKVNSPLCTCSGRRPRVTDGRNERQKDTFVNFPERASGILNFSH